MEFKPRRKEWGEAISRAKQGQKFSEEHKRNLSEAQRRRFQDPVQREYLSKKLTGCKPPPGAGARNWSGGKQGDEYEKILAPAGYVRESKVYYSGQRGVHFNLDFAHLEAKVNIEIDGPFHDDTGDVVRDAVLRSLGWKVIRIKDA